MSQKFLIVAGEHSGDLLGAELMKKLKQKLPGALFIGVGGKQMEAEGLCSIDSIENINIVGIIATILKYRYLKRLAEKLIQTCEEEYIKFAILIDYPGFNLRFAEILSRKKIKVIYYVSPQIWAWNFTRIIKIKENVNLMLTLFAFEKKIYDMYGVNSMFVGHPVKGRVLGIVKNFNPLEKNDGKITISLFPGSRLTKIRLMLPILLDSSVSIAAHLKDIKLRFLIVNINSKAEEFIRKEIKKIMKVKKVNLEYVFNDSIRAMYSSDLIILGSGTAVLEASILEKPMITITKINPVSYLIARHLINISYISLVNILSDREICREFIQKNCTIENIINETKKILTDSNYRNRMIENLREVNSILGGWDPAELASESIFTMILKEGE
jgi:lipid-A-disaccharide synthase